MHFSRRKFIQTGLSASTLIASATFVHGDSAMVLYEFNLADATRVLLNGRATIAFGTLPGEHTAMRALE